MKTILWLYTKPYNPEVGGIERITDLIMRGLTARGHRCMAMLVIRAPENLMEYNGEPVTDLYTFLKQNRVDTLMNQVGHSPNELKYFLDHGGKRWHDEGGKIISCLHYHPQPVSVHYQFSIKPNKTWHDYYVIAKSWLFHEYLFRRDRRIVGIGYRQIYDMSDLYVMLSESYRDYICKGAKIKDDSKLIAIDNPLTFDGISDMSLLEHKSNTILIVSRLMDWQKRVSISIKAWEQLCQKPSMVGWKMKIVGDGQDMERFKTYIAKHNIPRISLEGQQSPEPYYKDAKIFLMTSKTEGWGLTLTESLQRGVVPIAINTSSAFADIIIDGWNGYIVKEGSLSDFVEKIESLAVDGEKWHEMANNALLSAKKFSIEEVSKRWEEVI